jgi:hypothetical protein
MDVRRPIHAPRLDVGEVALRHLDELTAAHDGALTAPRLSRRGHTGWIRIAIS